MKKYFLSVSLILFTACMTMVMSSCGSDDNTVYDEKQDDFVSEVDYDEFSQELVELEKKILAQNPPDEKLLREATTKFQDFAGYFPKDPKAPDYLLKASDYALILNQPEKSVKLLQRIMDEYPEYEQMESVVYNKADHLDFDLRDTTAAKIAYQEFIDKYPNSPRVADAEIRIKYISLSLDEYANKIIEDYEKSLK